MERHLENPSVKQERSSFQILLKGLKQIYLRLQYSPQIAENQEMPKLKDLKQEYLKNFEEMFKDSLPELDGLEGQDLFKKLVEIISSFDKGNDLTEFRI